MDIISQSTQSCRSIGGLKCKSCGSTQQRIYKGVAHNIASLRCANCGHFFKWLSKAEFKQTGLTADTLPEYSPAIATGQLSLWGDL